MYKLENVIGERTCTCLLYSLCMHMAYSHLSPKRSIWVADALEIGRNQIRLY